MNTFKRKLTSFFSNRYYATFLFITAVTIGLGIVYFTNPFSAAEKVDAAQDVKSPPKIKAPSSSGKKPEFAEDRLLVKFNKGVDKANENAVFNRYDLLPVKEIGNTGIKIVKVKPSQSPLELKEKLEKNEKDTIEFAETDDLVDATYIPNDPYYSSQWHLPVMNAEPVWDEVSADSILIGICDTGVLATHQDLSSILRGDLGYNTVDNSTNWAPAHYHGTLVSGAAAAIVNNGIGVAGVAQGANIIPVRISNRSDGRAYVSDAAECITYAAENNARAINLSYRMAEYQTIHEAALVAETLGAVTSVSAGNDNSYQSWSDFSSFLAVAATDQNDQRVDIPNWWGSNYGEYVDIAAPGLDILTTSSDGSYAYASGTSLSAPLVTGSLALMFGADSTLTADEAKNIILSTAKDLGDPGEDIYYGAGRVDTYYAVSSVLGEPIPTGSPTPTSTSTPTPSPTFTPTPTKIPDNTAPTAPKNVERFNNNGVEIPLVWDASTDNDAIDHYNVYRNGQIMKENITTLYIDSNVTKGTWYEYYVTAVDVTENESAPSNKVLVVGTDSTTGIFFGQAIVSSTNQPVTGAEVSVRNATGKKKPITSAITDSQGRYVLYLDSSNDYQIEISKPGYDKENSPSITLYTGNSNEYNFSLTGESKGNNKNNNNRGGKKDK